MAVRKSKEKLPSDQRFGSECAAPPHPAEQLTDRVVRLVATSSTPLKPGETVYLSYGRNSARFVVSWAETPGAHQEGRVGLRSLSSGGYVWELKVATVESSLQTTGPHVLRLSLPQN